MTSLFGSSPFPITIGPKSLRDFGAVGNGVIDDTYYFNLAIAYFAALGGGYCQIDPNYTFLVTSKINLSSNTGFTGSRTSKVYAPSLYFNQNNQTSVGRYQSNSAVFDCSGQTAVPYTPSSNCRLSGFTIYSDSVVTVSPTILRICDAIVARNCIGLRIDDMEIYQFPSGCGIRAASLSYGCRITDCYIHDFYDNSAGWLTNGSNQITGIELDNDRINSVSSIGVLIERNTIRNMLLGAISSGSPGGAWQTDGITLMGGDTGSTGNWGYGHKVSSNTIDQVGEGIDSFAAFCTISNNVLTNCHFFGIKHGHGASYNDINDNIIKYYGLAGMTFYGGDSGPDTLGNNVSGGFIGFGNPIQQSTGLKEWAVGSCNAIRCQGTGASNKVKDLTVQNVTIQVDTNVDSAIYRGSDGTNINYRDNKILGTGASGRVTPNPVTGSTETGQIVDANPTALKVYLSANQAIATGAFTKVLFDTVLFDTRGEFAANSAVIQIPGLYNCSGSLRFGTLTVGDEIDIQVIGSSSGSFSQMQYRASQTTNNSFPFNFDVPVRQGETLDIQVKLSSAAGQNLTGNQALTFMSIKPVW